MLIKITMIIIFQINIISFGSLSMTCLFFNLMSVGVCGGTCNIHCDILHFVIKMLTANKQ